MQSYFLGVDVSKGYADLLLLDSNQRTVEPNFQLDDTFAGHCRLYEFLCRFFQDHPDTMVYAAVESTGGYESNWFNSLHKFQETLKIRVARLNPVGVHHNSRAGLQRVITDRVSARNVAEYMIKHPEKINYESDAYFGALKRKWQFIQTLLKQKTRLLNQLEKLLYIANPDVLSYCRDGVPQWVLRLLQKYPTSKHLARAHVKTVAAIPYIRAQNAKELIEAARLSVASAEDDLTADSIVIMSKEIHHLEQLADKQTKLLAEKCSLPELELLKTFSAIGDSSAIGLLLEIGAVQRFHSAKKLASFFGLHPRFKISGDGTSAMRMSKEGRKAPRAILYMVALAAINHNPLIRDVYEHNLAKGKCKMAAIGVCMHKILRIIYGMLKHNRAFDPEIDRKNRIQTVKKKSQATMDRNRRLQPMDDKAPISRRQAKKREEQKMSQDELVIV